MHFSVLPPWAAPVSTGHPFGLPETSAQTKSVTRVPAVTQQSSSDTGMMQEKSPNQYRGSSSGQPDPETHVAPPSIMQLKISAILTKQAEVMPDQGPEGETETESAADSGFTDEAKTDGERESDALPSEPRRDARATGYRQLPDLAPGNTPQSKDSVDPGQYGSPESPSEPPAPRLSYA